MRFYNIIHSLLLAKAEKEHNNLLEMALNCRGLFISLYPLKERLPEKKLLLTTLEISLTNNRMVMLIKRIGGSGVGSKVLG